MNIETDVDDEGGIVNEYVEGNVVDGGEEDDVEEVVVWQTRGVGVTLM